MKGRLRERAQRLSTRPHPDSTEVPFGHWDSALVLGDNLLLLGWCRSTEANVKINVVTESGLRASVTADARYPRADVCAVLGLPSMLNVGVAAFVPLQLEPGLHVTAEGICADGQFSDVLLTATAPDDMAWIVMDGYIDQCFRVESALVVHGWCRDDRHPLTVVVRNASGATPAVQRIVRYYRDDIAQALDLPTSSRNGFAAFVDLPEQSSDSVRVTVLSGSAFLRGTLPVLSPAAGDLSTILDTARWDTPDLVTFAREQLLPVFRQSVEAKAKDLPEIIIEQVQQWNWPAGNDPVTDVNIVIPIYATFEYLPTIFLWLEREWAISPRFVVTVVCDDPLVERGLTDFLVAQERMLHFPRQLVMHSSNFGFSQACESGVAATTLPFAFLWNSDLVPTHSDFLNALVELVERPSVAAAGPTLLYADGSVQHDGMRTQEHPTLPGFVFLEHPAKGKPFLAAQSEPSSVPLLTGAAILLRKSNFEEVGGFAREYGQGDYEDGDLSMALRQIGELLVSPAVTMWHVESASHASAVHQGYINVRGCGKDICRSLIFQERWPEIRSSRWRSL
jgi:GT2 family glycosyltransferase